MRHIDELYKTMSSPKSMDTARIMEVLHTPIRGQLILENNETKAKRLLRRFQEYFGK